MKTKTRFLTPVVFACLSLASTAHAATVSWTGATGGDWNTGGNWSGSAKPTPFPPLSEPLFRP
jgi:hypothetical protein